MHTAWPCARQPKAEGISQQSNCLSGEGKVRGRSSTAWQPSGWEAKPAKMIARKRARQNAARWPRRWRGGALCCTVRICGRALAGLAS